MKIIVKWCPTCRAEKRHLVDICESCCSVNKSQVEEKLEQLREQHPEVGEDDGN